MVDVLQEVFNTVYLRIYGDEYEFTNKKVLKCITDFIKKIPQSAGEDWLMEFIIFQFSYYSEMKMRFKRVYINWIFGPAALKRWKERTEQQSYYAGQYKQKLGIVKQFVKLSTGQYKENERRRFEDNNSQFLHCATLYLFDKSSKGCKECVLLYICNTKED